MPSNQTLSAINSVTSSCTFMCSYTVLISTIMENIAPMPIDTVIFCE